MRSSFKPLNRFAFIILISPLVCSACMSEDATAVKSFRCEAGNCAQDAAAGAGGVKASGGLASCQRACDVFGTSCNRKCASYSDQATKEACEYGCLETTQACDEQCASGGLDNANIGGTNGDSIAGSGGSGAADSGSASGLDTSGAGANGGSVAAGGSSGPGAAGAGGANGSTSVASCQLACDAQQGLACASMCIMSADVSACESACLESDKLCDAQCASSGLPPSNSSDPIGCQTECATVETTCTSTCIYGDPNVKTACTEHCAENGSSCLAGC